MIHIYPFHGVPRDNQMRVWDDEDDTVELYSYDDLNNIVKDTGIELFGCGCKLGKGIGSSYDKYYYRGYYNKRHDIFIAGKKDEYPNKYGYPTRADSIYICIGDVMYRVDYVVSFGGIMYNPTYNIFTVSLAMYTEASFKNVFNSSVGQRATRGTRYYTYSCDFTLDRLPRRIKFGWQKIEALRTDVKAFKRKVLFGELG